MVQSSSTAPDLEVTDEHQPGSVCAVFHRAGELIGRRWTGAIISILLSGPHRFHAVTVAIPGISERLLAQRLRELEAEGLVSRRILPGPPVGVEYALTEKGADLEAAISALGTWGHRWIEPAPS
jgi:DNA-binding HxlR family transcriptional regulator